MGDLAVKMAIFRAQNLKCDLSPLSLIFLDVSRVTLSRFFVVRLSPTRFPCCKETVYRARLLMQPLTSAIPCELSRSSPVHYIKVCCAVLRSSVNEWKTPCIVASTLQFRLLIPFFSCANGDNGPCICALLCLVQVALQLAAQR